MKPKKRIVALLLVWNIMIGMLPTVAFADNNSEIQLEEGVTYQDNGDGTATINVFQTPIYEEETNNGEQEGTFLVDSGDVFRSAEGIVDVEFPKAFRQGERIAEVGMMETAIAFIPENAPYEELVEEEQTDFPNSYSVPETEIDYAEKNWSDESLASFAWSDSIDQQDNGENEDLFDYNNDSREADLVTSFENNENQIEEKTSLEEVFENYDAGSIVTENTIDLSTSQEDVVIDEIENMVVPDISVEEVGITSIDNDVWEQNDEDETFVVITSDEKIDDAIAEYTENVGGEIEDIGEEQPWNKAYGETESYDSYAVYEEKPDDSIDYPTMVEAVTQNNESGTITSVYYPGAFNNSTDILLEPTTKGVKESIIINEFSTSEYSYTLQLDGLYPELFGNTVLLKDPSGAVSAALSAPYMFDAAGNYNYDIQVSFNAIGNNAFRLTYSMDKSWLESASYPVVIDPTVEYSFDYQNYKFIENAFISSTYPNATAATFAWSEQELTVGPYKYGEARSYFRMAFPDSVIQEMGNGILKDLTLHLYIRYGYGNYSMHQVVGGEWKKSTITWNNAPAFSSNAIDSKYIAGEGWTEWDLTKAASTWFNALDQAGAFGVCMKIDDGGGVCIASSLHDRDVYGYPAYYSITYYKDPSQPVVDVNAYGNGVNSGTGYVDLSWTPIDGADNYYIGVFNGKTYEYFNLGNRTSWSTKGKGLWPTESEINDGRFALHADGKGSELPMIPAFTYTNAGGGHEKDLNYYFTVIPANKYGQAPNPSNYSAIKVRLPDTLAPSEAKSVSTSPAIFTNSDSITVKWSGIKDYNNIQTDVTTSMGEKGNIQYAIDSSSAWENTDATDGDGSVVVDISKLEDGKHYVYIRGVDSAGNTGNGRFAVFYVDRTAPSAPKLEIIPDTWTRSDKVSLTWSGIADANELDRIEYSIDGSNFINTGKKEEAYSGYQIDIKSLQSGEHTLMLRAVDAAGNVGDAGTVKIQKDIVPPVFNSATVTPSDWSSEDTLRLEWQSLIDEHSGLKLVWYCIDSTTKTNLDTDKNLLTLLNISTLSDGEHRITLHFEDNAGNTEEQILNFYRDARAPEISLLSPIDESAVSGTVEIIGSIKDLSLANWKVIARSEKGDERTLASGTSAKDAERLAILNCADYDDGEKITIIVEARDKAGNEKRTSGTVVTVDKSSKPILPSVTIEEPEKNSIIESVSALGRYSTQSDTGEKEGFLYIDGIYQGTTRNKNFSFDAIEYPENSSHSISIISVAEDETIGYSEGLSSVILLSKVYDEDSTTISETVLPPYPVIALRLHASESVTNESTVIYWYSLDDGANWNAMPLETDIPLLQKPSSIAIKAEAENGASVSGLTLEGITETAPHLVSVKLLRPVDSFELEDKTITSALSELAEEPEGAESLYLFQEEKRVAESFTFDARTNGSGKVALIAMLPENKLLGSGAASEILLRESVDASGTTISDSLTGSGKVYALRLDALNTGNGKFFFSTDGETWTPIALGEYCVLEEAAEKVFVKAEIEEGVLQAWHVEGVVCKESNVRLELVKQPENVTAADWSQYYADRSKWRYDLSWTDPSPEDSSAEYETSYEIYRNGELIATVSETKFSDTEYVANAKYEVRTVRSYGEGYKNQISDKTAAKITTIQPPAKPIGVSYTPEEQNQSEYLNKLYGGNYIFGTEETTPTDDRQLNKALLGRNKYCGYGFEPINFNSGNFILEAEDVTLSDLGLAQFALRRTYNSQSEEKDGPFGAKWESPWISHLRIYPSDEIVFVSGDGQETVFSMLHDGSYTGGEGKGLILTKNKAADEYRIKSLEGQTFVFTGVGLLKNITWKDGSLVSVTRDKKGLVTGFVFPSGKTIKVESDSNGHIVKVTTLGGSTLKYEYQGRNLVKYTDAKGNETRYVYDVDGRMTAWYDAEGNCQVENVYDAENRVVSQTDANGGQYTIEYFADHTFTTDASGARSEYWKDEFGRTIKTVDPDGGEIKYAYDRNNNIISKTDECAQITQYEYDLAGHKVKETAPDGTSYTLEYDANDNLTMLTDQLGHTTRYEYDSGNRLTAETAADGGVIRYAYNEAGQVTSITDPNGARIEYAYNGAVLTETTDANGNKTTYAYDSENRLTAMTDALGNTTRFRYDAAGNLLEVSFADGSSFSYTYDAVGNMTSQTDALGHVTAYEYDAMHQLIRTIYPDGSESTNTYNESGELTSSVDALGNATEAKYDGNGRLLTRTDAMGNTTRYEYDKAGRLVGSTLPNGGKSAYTYDEVGQLLSVTGPMGDTTYYGYDAAGNTVSVTSPDGGIVEKRYDANNRLVMETAPNGAATRYTYDLAGRLTEKTDALGSVTSYSYDANGNLLTVTDALGGVTRYTYDALNRVVSMTDANGATTTYSYDMVGNLVSETDALGNVTSYAYDGNGSITGLIDALGGKSAMSYDALGNVVAVLQKNGGKVGAEYNSLGHLLSETDANGDITSYEYNANGLVTKITDALGQSAEIAYDENGNVARVGAPDGSNTSYVYDQAGRLTEETNAAGLTTCYNYDTTGRLVSTTVNGNETRFTYDLAGNITSVADAEGRKVELSYDALGNLTVVLYPDGTKDTYEYDALSRLVTYTPRLGDATAYTYDAMGDVLSVSVGKQTTRYEYDLLGRVTATITEDGARTEITYDALGNPVKTVDALGNATSYSYTVDSLLKEIRYANGATLSASYDLVGNLLNETDSEGNATAYEYDPVGRMTAVTDALGATTRYEYNAADKLAKVIDALGHETSYTYDATGNLASETDALGNTVKYSYTPEGWLETITDAEGHVTRYTYDRTGNVLTADYAGEQTETNTYNELGLLTTVTTAEGDTLYQYDAASRLISVTQPNGETVSYTYDSRGNRATMTYPNGKTAKYTYDDMNRLVSVKGVDGITTKYKYDALGRRIATNGAKEDTVYTYDEVGNLVRQTTTGAYDLALEYAYDLSGRMTQESRTENGATLDSVFTYDPLGQLTGFTRSDGQSESYAYDPVGNMTAKTQNSVKTAMTYNAANQLIQSVSGTDKTTYSYDANGNLVKSENAGGARSYTYNALGLLAQFTREDGYSESYTYNANRLLSGITNNTGTTALTYDILYGDGVVISSARNGVQTSYTYGLERISAQTGKTRTEYVYDGRGSVAAEVSYNNAWYTFGGGLAKKNFTTKSYTPFGEQIGEATSGFGYNGEYYNAATGMIYLRARFYAPEMNRFSQKDTLRGSTISGTSLNRYLYVQNDPVNFVDPSGMRQVAGMYGDGTGRTSTTRSSSRTSYTPPSYPAPSGPARSTASSVNPYNTVRATSQAISDARRAADIANSRAPGSPAAYRATQAYYETQRLAAQAMASHNTQAGIKAVQTSQASVNYVNNVVTSRAPNTYSPYDAHGNVYSYYNSSYDTGKIPTPDAPTIEDIDAGSVYYCDGDRENSAQTTRLSQNTWEKLKQTGIDTIFAFGTSTVESLKVNLTKIGNGFKNSSSRIIAALEEAGQLAVPQLVLAGELILVDGPTPGPGDIAGFLQGVAAVATLLNTAYLIYNGQVTPYTELEPKEPLIIVDPLPDIKLPPIETFPEEEKEKDSNVESIPAEPEQKGGNSTAIPLPEENTGNIVTASNIPEMQLDQLPKNVQESFEKYNNAGWKGQVSGQTPGTAAGAKWKNESGTLPSTDAEGNPINYREFDVNNKTGPTRDGERFVVGSDGSVYYTDSHYGEGTSLNGIDDFVKLR